MTQLVLAAVLGLLFAVGTFLVLRRDVVRVVWGVTIISQAANVYLVTMGGLSGTAPILGGGGEVTDPVVQALVLTAIVIGFGTTAFALVLTFRVYQTRGTIDLGEEPEPEPAAVAADGGAPAAASESEAASASGSESESEPEDAPETGSGTDGTGSAGADSRRGEDA